MAMKPKFYEWLKQQPTEFVREFANSELRGDGEFTIEDLIELDLKYNPEDKDND